MLSHAGSESAHPKSPRAVYVSVINATGFYTPKLKKQGVLLHLLSLAG